MTTTYTSTVIPFVDLKAQYADIKSEVDAAIEQVLSQTAFIKGRFVAAFEQAFAEFLGVKHAIGVGNGTDAILLALQALGIGAGDEVITVAHTFTATVEPIVLLGARPVFVDVDPVTSNLDATKLAAAITPRTKAIMPVHLYGMPADMDAINEIAARHSLYVIEDSAQAAGARYKGKRCGSLGTVSCFSFYPGKNLGAYGDGGAVCTDDTALAQKIRMLADHGRSDKYEHKLVGYNSRLDGLQAAILQVKLAHLDDWNNFRRAHALEYSKRLANVPNLKLPGTVAWAEPIWHLYVIEVPNREGLQKALKAEQIETGVHYPIPLHRQPCYQDFQSVSLPVTEYKVGAILSLPMFAELKSEQIERVVEAIIRFQREQ